MPAGEVCREFRDASAGGCRGEDVDVIPELQQLTYGFEQTMLPTGVLVSTSEPPRFSALVITCRLRGFRSDTNAWHCLRAGRISCANLSS